MLKIEARYGANIPDYLRHLPRFEGYIGRVIRRCKHWREKDWPNLAKIVQNVLCYVSNWDFRRFYLICGKIELWH